MYRLYIDDKFVDSFGLKSQAIDEAEVRWAMGEGKKIAVWRRIRDGVWEVYREWSE